MEILADAIVPLLCSPSTWLAQICHSPITWLTPFALAWHSSEILPCPTCLPWQKFIPSMLMHGGGLSQALSSWHKQRPASAHIEAATRQHLVAASTSGSQPQLESWPFPRGHKAGTCSGWPWLVSWLPPSGCRPVSACAGVPPKGLQT